MAQLSFHKLYDAHHRANSEDLPFWLALAEQHPDPLLELGCGTGRVLIPLASQGRKLVGIDRDAQMLELLRQREPVEYAQNTHLIQADFTRFVLAMKFNLIFMPCNTYSTLSSVERASTLGCVRQHLLDGGTLALSLPNPELFKELPARSDYELEDSFPHPEDGEPVLVSSAWRRNRTHFTVLWQYDRLHPDGTMERYQTEARHWLTPTQVFLDEIVAAGYQIEALFGDFDRSDYQKDADHLIILAK